MSDMTHEERQAHLFAAVAVVGEKARGVVKASANKHQGYDYASSEHIIIAANEAMEGSGLAVIPTTSEIVSPGDYEKVDNSGSRMIPLYVLQRGYIVTHHEGGSMPGSMSWPLEINKGKGADKAAGSAETTCFAYFLRSLFNMPRLSQDDMNYVEGRKPSTGSTAPAVEMPNTALQALVNRIRSIDSPEKLAAADKHVSGIADAINNGGHPTFDKVALAVLMSELDAKR